MDKTVLRRVAPSRKRNGDNFSKTPKKQRPLRQSTPQKEEIWIDNSFLPSKAVANLKVKKVHDEIEDEDYAAAHHQSFNEGDSLLEGLEIPRELPLEPISVIAQSPAFTLACHASQERTDDSCDDLFEGEIECELQPSSSSCDKYSDKIPICDTSSDAVPQRQVPVDKLMVPVSKVTSTSCDNVVGIEQCKKSLSGIDGQDIPFEVEDLLDDLVNSEFTLSQTQKDRQKAYLKPGASCDISKTSVVCDVGAPEPTCLSEAEHVIEEQDMNSDIHPATPQQPKSFRDRLKATLQGNARVASPGGAGLLQQLKDQSVQDAVEAAQQLQQCPGVSEVGPFYGLPSKVQQLLQEQRGIKQLYAWQNECLTLDAVTRGDNLIYSLPTSGGKTLVAEILILRTLLCAKKDAILVLPYVAIVQEKVRGISQFAVDLDFLVEEYAGSKGSFPPKKRRHKNSLFICTIEKANSLVNSFIEHGRLDSVGLVVVDEVHMLGEGGSRGAALEMTLAKLLHSSTRCQIVGMSATLNNIADLQLFLKAEVYSNDFRPVMLEEYIKLDETIYSVNRQALVPDERLAHHRVLTFKYDAEMRKQDPDQLTALVMEVIPTHSCLIFCSTKKNCENVSQLLCRLMPSKLRSVHAEDRRALGLALRSDSGGELCPVLYHTIPYGIAYHHSGLTSDERRLIEDAYSQGTLCALTCTSTLAAGVNLPAKRVIVRSPFVGRDFLSSTQYRQMVGRAGRAGLDTSGESILLLHKRDKAKVADLVSGPCESCHSSLLYEGGKGIRALLLTTIGLQITTSSASVCAFLRRTLYYIQQKHFDVGLETVAAKALQSLLDLGLITQKAPDGEQGEMGELPALKVTNLGKAVFKGSIDVDRGEQLYRDLCAGRDALCVANYLHLLYLMTPYDLAERVTPDWMLYFTQLGRLAAPELQVAATVGVSEAYVSKRASGQSTRKAVDQAVMRRFYLTLILYELWRGRSVWTVAAIFQQPRGFVQQLLSGAAAFAACVTHFCQELDEFWAYQDLLTNFVRRLSYCVAADLIPLMEIPGVKHGRACQLLAAGYGQLQKVAHADPETLAKAIEHLSLRNARQITAAAQLMVREKAESLRDEADELITMPTDIPQ